MEQFFKNSAKIPKKHRIISLFPNKPSPRTQNLAMAQFLGFFAISPKIGDFRGGFFPILAFFKNNFPFFQNIFLKISNPSGAFFRTFVTKSTKSFGGKKCVFFPVRPRCPRTRFPPEPPEYGLKSFYNRIFQEALRKKRFFISRVLFWAPP